MPSPISIGTRDIPLKLAEAITRKANESWESGEMLSRVSLTTQDLLKFWFMSPHTETRYINFHEGQRQAILNTVYLHEVLGTKTVKEVYENIYFELLQEIDIAELKKAKYEIPKYAIKMATGTGKTWVMHALLIWQYLNAKHETEISGKFTKNFLFVAPGIIVYERLLDAYLGKENEKQERDFEKSDFSFYKDLFIPPNYREEVFGFIQNSVAKKQGIGVKVTGDGLIAIANWHLFLDKDEKEGDVEKSPFENTAEIVKDIRPISPGISGGNTLDSLDSAYLSGREIDYLEKLPDLMTINDEAHHIHENKVYGEIQEVEWQKSLNRIAKNKGNRFMQVDFSATPYDVTGSGPKRLKHYFPHTIVNFDLKTAIRGGYVKTIAIDKRKEFTDIEIDYSAKKENKKVVALSEGQMLMLRAGLGRLKILEEQFVAFTKDKNGVSNKHPKMLVMCENTDVSPLVVDFLKLEGLQDDEVIRIDSNQKGEIPEKEWAVLKQKLFNIDKSKNPKVIVSVLMLREGFDVNNVCVIVPLRASSAPILLEQTIGRGLRLMWREPEYSEFKKENIRRLLYEKKEPKSFIDLLSIVEHPAFLKFYEDLDNDILPEIEKDPKDREGVLGDIIKVGLKADYKKYDLYWPVIIKESEESLTDGEFGIDKLESFTIYSLEDLKKFFNKKGEQFVAEELIVKTRFGEYSVDAALFKSESYNEYLEKILNIVVNRMARISTRKTKLFPAMQINNLALVKAVDLFIKTKLFGQPFDPMIDNNWKVLLMKNGVVTEHIIKEIGKVIFEMQNAVDVEEARIEKRFFSDVPELRMRENYSIDIVKTIYEKLRYPSNKGGFEKDFMEYADSDSKVKAIMKVDEYYHNFANLTYVRNDGFLSLYLPDFIVKTAEKVYVIEIKSDKDLNDINVKQKQLATLDWVKRVNQLKNDDRMNREWQYILLGETHFYGLRDNKASIDEICQLAKVTLANAEGKLFL